MFIGALFMTAKTWKQLKCPSKDEWVKNDIITFGATWMDLEVIILNEVSQKENMMSLLCGL